MSAKFLSFTTVYVNRRLI